MSLSIQSADRQAVVSSFRKGDSGFRFIRVISSDASQVRFSVGNRVFTALCPEKLAVGMIYRVRLIAVGEKTELRIVDGPLSPENEGHSRPVSVARHRRGLAVEKMNAQTGDLKKASAEWTGNRLEAPASQTEAFYANLFSCRFDDPDFAEELELFNACGTPPRFRSVIPFEWNGISGYLDLMVAGNRLVSYRLRILSKHIGALIHTDPISREMTVDTFGDMPLTSEELAKLPSLISYRLRAGGNLPSAVAYVEENPYREFDEWM